MSVDKYNKYNKLDFNGLNDKIYDKQDKLRVLLIKNALSKEKQKLIDEDIFLNVKHDEVYTKFNPYLNMKLINKDKGYKITLNNINNGLKTEKKLDKTSEDNYKIFKIKYIAAVVNVKKLFDVINSILLNKKKSLFSIVLSKDPIDEMKNIAMDIITLANLLETKYNKDLLNEVTEMRKLENEHTKKTRVVGKELFPMGRKKKSNTTYNNQKNTGTNTICDIINDIKMVNTTYNNLTEAEAISMLNNLTPENTENNSNSNEIDKTLLLRAKLLIDAENKLKTNLIERKKARKAREEREEREAKIKKKKGGYSKKYKNISNNKKNKRTKKVKE